VLIFLQFSQSGGKQRILSGDKQKSTGAHLNAADVARGVHFLSFPGPRWQLATFPIMLERVTNFSRC